MKFVKSTRKRRRSKRKVTDCMHIHLQQSNKRKKKSKGVHQIHTYTCTYRKGEEKNAHKHFGGKDSQLSTFNPRQGHW